MLMMLSPRAVAGTPRSKRHLHVSARACATLATAAALTHPSRAYRRAEVGRGDAKPWLLHTCQCSSHGRSSSGRPLPRPPAVHRRLHRPTRQQYQPRAEGIVAIRAPLPHVPRSPPRALPLRAHARARARTRARTCTRPSPRVGVHHPTAPARAHHPIADVGLHPHPGLRSSQS